MKRSKFYNLFWIFMIGSVFGWLAEVLFAFAKHGQFCNRSSLIYGPFGLAYGIGALVLTLCLKDMKNKSLLQIFTISFLSGSICEYIFSWGMELVLGFCCWDYTNLPLNINGRICLLYSIFWGILGIAWVKLIYPELLKMIQRIPYNVGTKIMKGLIIFLVFDIIISAAAVYRQYDRKNNVKAENTIQVFLDKYYNDEFLEFVYPGINELNKGG